MVERWNSTGIGISVMEYWKRRRSSSTVTISSTIVMSPILIWRAFPTISQLSSASKNLVTASGSRTPSQTVSGDASMWMVSRMVAMPGF